MPRIPFQPSHDTRSELLEVALRCFAEHGFEATSTRLIASQAKRNMSLIAYHFGGKEGLYREVIRTLGTRFSSSARRAGGAIDPEPVGKARLQEAAASVLAQLHPCAHASDPFRAASARLWRAALSAPRTGTQDLVRAYLAPLADEFRAGIREMSPGLREAEVELWGSMALDACFGRVLMVESDGLVWKQDRAGTDPRAVSERLATCIFLALQNGITPR